MFAYRNKDGSMIKKGMVRKRRRNIAFGHISGSAAGNAVGIAVPTDLRILL